MNANNNTVSGTESGSGAAPTSIFYSGASTTTYSITCTSVGASVSSTSPSTASAGSSVIISGGGFWGTSKVMFGAFEATVFTVSGSSTPYIRATVPDGSGTVTISVTTDAGGPYSGGTFTFAPPTANAVSATVAHGSSNNVITHNASGNPTSVTVVSTPAHGSATASGSTITYTPNASYSGPDSFTYTAANNAGVSNPNTVSIMVDAPPAVTLAPVSLGNGTYGAAYAPVTFSAGGGTAPYSYSATGLPPGMGIDANTGVLSGTPTAAGTYSVQVMATDSTTGTGPASQTHTIPLVINKANQAPLMAAATSSPIAVGATSALSASGGSSAGAVSYAVTTGAAFCSLDTTTQTLTGTSVGTCTVTATKAADANYNAASAITQIIVANTSYTGTTTTSTGIATASFISSSGCSFTTSQFIGTGAVTTLPSGYSFPQGLFDFTAQNCAIGSDLTMKLVYPQTLPPSAVLLKYGPTSTNTTPHWYPYPATISGNTVTYTLKDGADGDDDMQENGVITDAVGIGVPTSVAAAVPALERWALLLLTLLATVLGGYLYGSTKE